MPLSLPSLSVDATSQPPRASSSHGPALRPGELSELLGLEGDATVPWRIERCVPLVDRRWAVARRDGERTVWRIVPADAIARLPHPAWLWVSSDWLDPDQAHLSEVAPTPPSHPLRTTLRRAQATAPSPHNLYKTLAGLLATLRRREPVAVRVSSHTLRSAEQPAQALVLAVLTVLPTAWREALRVSVGDPTPAPGAWDLVVTEGEPEGYVVIDPVAPPDEGEDLVAFYVRNRLMGDDPEAVEAAAWLPAGRPGDRDPWGTAVAALLRDGADGSTRLDPRWLRDDPERAVRAVTARVLAGAALDDVVDDLVNVTVRTRDERPWRALRARPAVQRARAVQALLPAAPRFRPTATLLARLTSLYPRGAALDRWVSTLLGWLHEGVDPAAITSAMQTTLLEWPLAATRATRSSVWSEVVYGLVALGEDDAAMDALVSPVARQIALDGAGRALVANWSIVPAAFRDHQRLGRLVRLLANAPDGHVAIVDLLHHVRERPDEAEAVLLAWVDARDEPSPDDPVFQRIRDTPLLATWLAAVLSGAEPFAAGERVRGFAAGPDDPLWVEAEAAYQRLAGLSPRDRFLALAGFTDGIPALAPVAPVRLRDAVGALTAPDAEIAAVAERLAQAPDAPPLWAATEALLSTPGRLDDATVDDAMVRALAEAGPRDAALLARMLRAVGASDAWEPLEVARWLVRVRLAPGAPAEAVHQGTRGVMQGVASRHDALPVLIELAKALLELPADHPAAHDLLAHWLPAAFPSGMPQLFATSLDPLVPPRLRAVWTATKRRC